MVITEIWRYPVKSMGGERLDAAHITDTGIEFDRGWGVFDPQSSTVLTGRREPKLLLGRAEVRDGELLIYTERGAVIGGNLEAMSDALTGWLGRRVELRRAGPTGGTYESPLDAESEQDWVDWTGPPDAWHDSAHTRVSLLSAASTATIDPRRFRSNLITDGAAQQEESWAGMDLQLGADDTGVGLEVTKQIQRCVMIGRPQADLDADRDALRWVIHERSNLMGIGAMVTRPGMCTVGDEIRASIRTRYE